MNILFMSCHPPTHMYTLSLSYIYLLFSNIVISLKLNGKLFKISIKPSPSFFRLLLFLQKISKIFYTNKKNDINLK